MLLNHGFIGFKDLLDFFECSPSQTPIWEDTKIFLLPKLRFGKIRRFSSFPNSDLGRYEDFPPSQTPIWEGWLYLLLSYPAIDRGKLPTVTNKSLNRGFIGLKDFPDFFEYPPSQTPIWENTKIYLLPKLRFGKKSPFK